ncbi:hypothetical protein [Promicromonospora iranensis]|uniref:HEAT repeat protein n=1 Tax=Promicromonospora iranensis TaxID=1105144 RepID=A0ABU2CIN6_9MICO|nr:hypothetical protein [Promicromonospora iranensis]MDR7381178.1 hypothetical protein [Promicromonospora iranensis]
MGRTRKPQSRGLYGHYSAATHRGDLAELIDLVAHPDTGLELLAVIAPSIRDKDADAQLIHHVLDHPVCSEAIASRYATHHEADVRLRVATFPTIGSAVLAILAVDADDRVREAAARRLDAMGDALRPDRSA